MSMSMRNLAAHYFLRELYERHGRTREGESLAVLAEGLFATRLEELSAHTFLTRQLLPQQRQLRLIQ